MTPPIRLDASAAPLLAAVHATAFPRPWSEGDIADMLRGLGAAALGLTESGALQGFVMVRVAADEAEILTLAVRPEARRRGLGASLVQAIADLAAEAGAQSLWLEVAADNAAALGLYQAAGFERHGLRPGYYRREAGPAVDAVVMRRALNTGTPSPYSP